MREFKEPFFIGIDIGTQGLRTGIIDSCGNILSQHEQFYETFYPEVGWAEQKPLEWWNALNSTMKGCIADLDEMNREKIIAICVCATSSTVLPVDQDGNPLSDAMLWMDARSVQEANFINQKKHHVLEYCGGEVSAEWLVPKVLWVKGNKRELYTRCYKFVEQLDWINYKLTGKWIGSICNATCKWNYIDIEGGWNEDYFKSIGLEDYNEKLITDIKKVGEPISRIDKGFAGKFGLPESIVVVQGGIDAHMGMLGLGVTETEKVGIIMGTSFVHLALSQKPVFQKGIWGPYHGALLPEYWLLEGGQISSGSIVKWFKQTFNVVAENPYDFMSEEASKIPVGAEGLVVLDFFQGNRTPYKDSIAKGVIYGLNLKHSSAHIYRAVLESVAFGTRNIIENFSDQGCEIESIVACGGVVKDPLWLRIISDVTGKPIIITKNSQAGILGCCIAAAVGMKVYDDFITAAAEMVFESDRIKPDLKNYELYTKSFKVYLEIYQSLKHVMHEKIS